MEAIEYKTKIVQRIRPVFESSIFPRNILYVFHRYDPGVLVPKDIDAVKACCNTMGDIEGATLLLDRISLYDNWFECLLKVLRDPQVKLSHVARALTALKDEGDHELNTVLMEYDEPIEELFETLQINTSLETDYSLVEATEDIEYIEATEYGPREDNQRERPRAVHRKIPRSSKVTSELPERDFPEEEVNILSSFPGWHDGIESKQVLALLKPHKSQTGSYIIWYWKDKKRPAISVTHNNKVKTFILHKRSDPADNKKVDFYFINKHEKTCNSLNEIVDHHIKNGVFDLSRKPQIIRIFLNKAI